MVLHWWSRRLACSPRMSRILRISMPVVLPTSWQGAQAVTDGTASGRKTLIARARIAKRFSVSPGARNAHCFVLHSHLTRRLWRRFRQAIHRRTAEGHWLLESSRAADGKSRAQRGQLGGNRPRRSRLLEHARRRSTDDSRRRAVHGRARFPE